MKVVIFIVFFSRHHSYLHDFGALGPFAGSRPPQHENNLRLHHQRHPVQQARHPLEYFSEQTADHKPATGAPNWVGTKIISQASAG